MCIGLSRTKYNNTFPKVRFFCILSPLLVFMILEKPFPDGKEKLDKKKKKKKQMLVLLS